MVEHRARQMRAEEYGDWDRIVYMDRNNEVNLMRMLGGDPDGKCVRLLECLGTHRDVADPWYTADFDATYRDVMAGCRALLMSL